MTSADVNRRDCRRDLLGDPESPLLTVFRRTMVHVECTRMAAWGGLMPRGMVALLAAVAAGLPVLAVLAHGDLVWAMACDVAGAAGLVAYVSAAPILRAKRSSKKNL